jgi:hypothetical protein
MTDQNITAAYAADIIAERDDDAAIPAYWHCHAARHIMRPLASEFPRTYTAIFEALSPGIDWQRHHKRHQDGHDDCAKVLADLIPAEAMSTIQRMYGG